MKTADEIMQEEFCKEIFDKLDKTEIQYIKDALKQIAELAFDAGETYYREDWPNKELFIKQLFPTQ